nr:C-type lectin domain family 2 member D-like isoform X2 [Zootoca vivipara]
MATGKMEARSESEEEHLNSLHPQKEQKEASAPPKIWKYRSVKDILIGILVFLVITLTITIIAVTAPRDAEPPGHRLVPSALCGPPCPHRWIGYAGKCYHFSKMKMNWNSSSSYCKSHNASLARIGSEEQEFVKHLTGPHYFWIGLRRDPGQPWKWLNGENSTLRIADTGGECVHLDEKATASASGCHTELPCICSKPSACTSPNCLSAL